MEEITIHIPTLMYGQLEQYCSELGEDMEDFIFNLVADKLFTDVHGDLNEKIKDQTPVVAETVKKEEVKQTAKAEVKKEEPVADSNATVVTETVVSVPPTVEVTQQEKVEKKPAVKRTTRSIKTK